MSLRYFVHVLFKRKWFILIALIAAPLIAGGILLFVEPIYVSHCKLEVHDRNHENDPIGERRPSTKDDVFIQTQIDLIFTDKVMEKVVDKAGLFPAPPSQSTFAWLTGIRNPASKYAPDRERIEIVRSLKNKDVKADASNSVVLNITAQQNTAELAQKVTKAVYEAYKEEFERLQKEDTQFEKYYRDRLAAIDKMLQEVDDEMVEFNRLHPIEKAQGDQLLKVPLPDTHTPNNTIPTVQAQEPFNPRMNEISPVQMVMNEIARLETNEILSKNSKDSYAYKQVEQKIEANKKVLAEYQAKLSEQEILAVRYSSLTWKREQLRQARQTISTEQLRLQAQLAVKGNSFGTIQVQDPPTYDPQAIFPKRTMILIAAAFIGLVLGLAMAYIAHVLDATYHLPEDFIADTGVPVLATIPFDKKVAA